ncbi:MAG: phosphatidic acid phosphatase, partial [Lachnospiraceae bacterium]
MKKIIAKIFSPWGLVPLIMALLCNFAVYSGCNALTRNWNLHSLAIPLDKQIPLIPWTIVIYFGCYIFWIINYILIYRRSREYAYRFFVADFLSRIVCLVFFLCYPTTLVRPAVEGEGIFYDAIRFLYKIDAPTNLFPSIHCLVSWFCFIGIISDI